MKVLGISGSLRADSYNRQLLALAGETLAGDSELIVWDGLKDVPPFDDDDRAAGALPEAVADLREAIASADAVLIATPEYNQSIPGVLKNALDWLSRPLAESPLLGKPAAVIGTSTGMFGAVWAQEETRKVLKAIGARVLDCELAVPRARDVDFETDPELRAQIADLLTEFGNTIREQPLAA